MHNILDGYFYSTSRKFSFFGVQLHRSKSFKLSNNPYFAEEVRDIVNLYRQRHSRRAESGWFRRQREADDDRAIKEAGGEATPVSCNVTKQDEVANLVQTVVAGLPAYGY
jgi:hypothetical protein